MYYIKGFRVKGYYKCIWHDITWKLSIFKMAITLTLVHFNCSVKSYIQMQVNIKGWNCQKKTNTYMTVNSVHGSEGYHQFNIVIYMWKDLAVPQIVCWRHADYFSTVSSAYTFWYKSSNKFWSRKKLYSFTPLFST